MKKFLVLLMMSAMSINTAAFASETAEEPAPPGKLQAQVEQTVIATEILDIDEYSPSDTVKITADKYVITRGSVIYLNFSEKFRSKKQKKGDRITFVNKNSVKTTKGTVLIPEGTQFIATITDIKKTRKLNGNARVYIQFDKMILSGKEIIINARPFCSGYALKENKSRNVGRGTAVTAVAAGVGAAVGAGVGSIIAGAAVGGGVGLVYSVIGPGVNYRAKAGEQIPVLLINDIALPR